MESTNLNTQTLKRNSILSVFTLTSRTVLLQIINLIGFSLVTYFLGITEFGIFIIVSSVIDILGYFSDIGLAAALVQKKEEPTLEEIRSTFTIQQALVIGSIIVLVLLSPTIKRIYGLSDSAVFLLYSFSIAFFFSSLKTIPTVILERKIMFARIVIPQIAETLIFNIVVVIMAWKGFGLSSYAWAVLSRALVGLVVMYIIQPWSIGLAFSKSVMARLMKFGIPFQLNSLVALVKDKIMVLVLGGILGTAGIGILGWAEKWASTPLRYFLDSAVKVAFPTFSRVQEDKQKLKRGIEFGLMFLSMGVFPLMVGMIVLAKPLLLAIPRYQKWLPALLPLYIYGSANLISVISTFLTNVLSSIGRIKTVLKLMILWTTLTWVLSPILAFKFGVVGPAVATLTVAISSLLTIKIVQRYADFRLWESISVSLISSATMLIALLILKNIWIQSISIIILEVFLGGSIYMVTMLLLGKDKVIREIKMVLSYVKK